MMHIRFDFYWIHHRLSHNIFFSAVFLLLSIFIAGCPGKEFTAISSAPSSSADSSSLASQDPVPPSPPEDPVTPADPVVPNQGLSLAFEKKYFDPEALVNDFSAINEDSKILNLGKTNIGTSQTLSIRMRIINSTASAAAISVLETPNGVTIKTPSTIPANAFVEYTVDINNASAVSVSGNYKISVVAGSSSLQRSIQIVGEVLQ